MIPPDLSLDTALFQKVAPTILAFLNSRPSRFHHTVSSGDAINTYGRSVIHLVRVEVWRAKCVLCGESEESRQVAVCSGHRYESGWRVITETEDSLFHSALFTANKKLREYCIVAGIKLNESQADNPELGTRQQVA